MPDTHAYLLVLARVTDRARFSRYVSGLPPIYARFGGRYLAVASAPTVEQFGHAEAPQSVMLSRWPSMNRLREFWDSRQYRSAARVRAGTGDFLVTAMDGEPECPLATAPSVLATILGPGPSPALLEAEGACPLALARERQVVSLEGIWPHGDCAMYSFAATAVARRLLLQFNTAQRGRSLLFPALPQAASNSVQAASA